MRVSVAVAALLCLNAGRDAPLSFAGAAEDPVDVITDAASREDSGKFRARNIVAFTLRNPEMTLKAPAVEDAIKPQSWFARAGWPLRMAVAVLLAVCLSMLGWSAATCVRGRRATTDSKV
eukprot:gnl/TRDRNA2_/TRDRNA2_181443_c0_seq1.p1 gnl/TRDRNA2_/TRDRNA2_181443_c0~~gnl/TRDRNA2_/TRDRNA2_181443_c0_seq1.p1  ORF type:complete len:120 (+),score=13.60 gnl/TRDRNA2_/TRDRNA2_181443_c0_seq1:61-420(+)